MALNWSVSGVEDWQNVTRVIATYDSPMEGIVKGDRILNPVTQAIIYRCMAVGIGRLTEKNIGNFYCRSRLLDAFETPALYDADHKPRAITIPELRAHIGLTTNVTTEGEAVWRKRMLDHQMNEFAREIIRHNMAEIEAEQAA